MVAELEATIYGMKSKIEEGRESERTPGVLASPEVKESLECRSGLGLWNPWNVSLDRA